MLIHLRISRGWSFFHHFSQLSPTRFFPHLQLCAGEKLLEFGCGAGLACTLFDPKFYIGTDIDGRRISYARGAYRDYTFEKCEPTSLPFQDNEFDKSLVLAVFHHISNETMETALHELQRVLKPSGFMVVVEPYLTASALRNTYMNLVDQGKFIRHKNEYYEFFKKCFEVENLEAFITPVRFPMMSLRLHNKKEK